MLSFWAWLLTFIVGRWVHKGILFWIANLIAAVAFAAGHLPTVMILSGTTNLVGIAQLVLAEVFVLNEVFGIVAGVYYWRYGLVAVAGIHFWADIVWHVIWPLLFSTP